MVQNTQHHDCQIISILKCYYDPVGSNKGQGRWMTFVDFIRSNDQKEMYNCLKLKTYKRMVCNNLNSDVKQPTNRLPRLYSGYKRKWRVADRQGEINSASFFYNINRYIYFHI